MDFTKRLYESRINPNEAGLYWLGQAGFLIKNSRGEICAVDPYLSDAVERICGLKRLMMPVISVEELRADVIAVSHHHEDHLDLDSLPVMLADGRAKLLAPDTCIDMCRAAGINQEQLILFNEGDRREEGGFSFEAVFADHGDSAPDAIGMIIETEGVRLYFASDSSYQEKRMAYAASKKIDVLIVPINGEYGNFNSRDAVMLARLVKPRLTIPSHFWMFARHKADPYEFDREMRVEAPDCPFYMMCQGEELIIKRKQ